MSITIAELKNRDKDSYRLIDIRDAIEISHGAVPDAIAVPAEEIETSSEVDKDKLLVIFCARGVVSIDVAEHLKEKGYQAESLEGGYAAWLLDVMSKPEEQNKAKDVELSLRKKFKKSIWSKFTKAINTYELVKPGDKIAVCISGGKDSMLMAKCFQELKLHNKFEFEVKFLVMDPGYSEANRKVIEENAKSLNIPITIFESDIFESVFTVEKSPCYLCARMRRGHLYHFAQELGCNKIALGHHYDDVIETILMGMLYGAQVQTMMPKLHSTNFEGMELIRPLYLVREDDIKAWRDYNGLHFIQCACKFTDTCTTCNNENFWRSLFLVSEPVIVQLTNYNTEVLLINDGSSDQTLTVMKEICASDSHYKYISFSRNFGKEAAMYAGFCNSDGDYAAVMDLYWC